MNEYSLDHHEIINLSTYLIMKKIFIPLLILAAVIVLVFVTKNTEDETLNQEAEQITYEKALAIALDDEYRAMATYDAVMENFGEIRPFNSIKKAEQNHISSLLDLYDYYELEVPENEWEGKVEIADTLEDNCQIGVQAEIDNADLYKNILLPAVEDYSNITQVFTNLMNASQNNHLPAFKRCS